VTRLPAYESRVETIGAALGRRMTGSSHDPASCPLPLDRLRVLTVSYVGFDGGPRTGRLVVRASLADDVTQVFGRLYDARWPLRRMQLVDAYDGDDDRSMAANNSSGYNCRRVAGSSSLSDHAFGQALDLNPVQNPYLTGGDVLPPPASGTPTSTGPRPRSRRPGWCGPTTSWSAPSPKIGWAWGGDFSEPDYQHFYRP